MRIGSLLVAAALISVGPRADARAPSYSVKIFARVPSPGHPFGPLVAGDRVMVSTSAGHPVHANSLGERIFILSKTGRLLRTVTVDEGANSTMGLAGLAVDGRNRIYAADMNGLVRRFKTNWTEEVFASAPAPYSSSWRTAMWNDIDFDAKGNAYITDGFPAGRIWKVSPGGTPSLWFSDARLSFAGPFQAQIDARGKYLYFAVVLSGSPDRLGSAGVYRLPLNGTPTAGDLEEIHRFSPEPGDVARFASPREGPYGGAETNGFAIGRSGRMYVALSGRDQLAVLDHRGRLLRMVTSPLFHYPVYMAFLGNRLLVANQAAGYWDNVQDRPDRWTVVGVDVGDTGIKPFTPRNVR